jgi:hypothetical protein
MDIIQVAKDIEGRIDTLTKGRAGLEQRAVDKANSISAYDKALKIEILKLKDGGKLPATLIEKVARGTCHKERLAMELADAMYKIQSIKLTVIQAELNGFQSIYRHLDTR